MSAAGEPAPAEEPAYFRGSAVTFERGQAKKVMLGVWLGLLAVLLVVLAVTAVGDTSRRGHLSRGAVPVRVTVTNCVAVASGTGETVAGSMCRGTYVLDGHTHQGLVHGMPTNAAVGTTLAALVNPAHPSSLSTADSVAAARSSWQAFVPAGITALLLVLSLAAVWWGRARRAAGHSARWWRHSPPLSA